MRVSVFFVRGGMLLSKDFRGGGGVLQKGRKRDGGPNNAKAKKKINGKFQLSKGGVVGI